MRKGRLLLFCAVILACGTSTGVAQDRKLETMFDDHFSVIESGNLVANASDADVHVTSGKAGDVHVRIVLEGRDMARAREYYERQHITVTKDGNTVRVNSDPERHNFSWRDWRDHPQIEIQVTIPEVFNADVRSSDGDLSLQRLRGNVHLETSDGDISTGELDGQRIQIRTSDGDVTTGVLSAETIEITTSDGDLKLGDMSAGQVIVRASDGEIRASAVAGDADVRTSDGDIRFDSFHGETLYARTSDGSIRVDRVDSRSSRVSTSDGGISLMEVDGDVEVSTGSGDIRLELRKPGAISARTSDGDVMIVVPSGHRADVQLRGDIQMAHASVFSGEIDEHRVAGRLNGGGPLIEAVSADGSVRLDVR